VKVVVTGKNRVKTIQSKTKTDLARLEKMYEDLLGKKVK